MCMSTRYPLFSAIPLIDCLLGCGSNDLQVRPGVTCMMIYHHHGHVVMSRFCMNETQINSRHLISSVPGVQACGEKSVHWRQLIMDTGEKEFLAMFTLKSTYDVQPFRFETMFLENYKNAVLLWLRHRWWHPFMYSIIYLCVMFGIRRIMQNRQPFNLRPLLIAWDASLAAMSIIGTWRMLPELFHAINNHGLQYAVCIPSFYEPPPTAFWATVFLLSKVVELGDTLFIVLRKQPLIFLHWYHHITVMTYVWITSIDPTGPGRWFMDINYFVHAVMYSYYTMRAMRFRIPKQVNMIVTVLQLSQMIVGSVLNIWVAILQSRGQECYQSPTNFWFSTLMYISYFALFGNYFYRTYLAPRNRKSDQKALSCRHLKNGYTNGSAVSTSNGHFQLNGFSKKND